MHRFRSVAFLICFIVAALPPNTASAFVDKALQAAGWREIGFKNMQENRFRARPDETIEVSSRDSVSLLQRSVMTDIKRRPILHWQWRMVKSAPPTDLSKKGGDDRSLAIYVTFPFVESEATFLERIERKIVEATAGKDAPGRVLMYVWGGDNDDGVFIPNPYFGNSGLMKILRSSKTHNGRWFTEDINIRDDYRHAFGSEAPNPTHLAISADTDDTNSSSMGFVMGLEFLEAPKSN